MTPQLSDWLRYEGERVRVFGFPLEEYFDRERPRPDFNAYFPGCERGYIAEWEIEEDALYLVGLVGWVGEVDAKSVVNPTEIPLADVIPWAGERVKATWFTGKLVAEQGERLRWAPRYCIPTERDIFLTFENGRLVATAVRDNAELARKVGAVRPPDAPAPWYIVLHRRAFWIMECHVPLMWNVSWDALEAIVWAVFVWAFPFSLPYLIWKRGWDPRRWLR